MKLLKCVGLFFVMSAGILLRTTANNASARYRTEPHLRNATAGFRFRQRIDWRFCGATPISPERVGPFSADLPNGVLLLRKDCTRTMSCSSGSTWAYSPRRQWNCSDLPVDAHFNVNGQNRPAAATVKTAKGPAQTKNMENIIWRALLVSSNGYRVSNGTTASHMVIDESAKSRNRINDKINVKAPPYLAKGNGSNDDTPAIQAAVNASCAASVSRVNQKCTCPRRLVTSVTRPPSPILLTCSLKFNGSGWQQTRIFRTIWAQPSSRKEPKMGGSRRSCRVLLRGGSPHSYAQNAEILDSNGNVEVATKGGTSGRGRHPAWPVNQPGTVVDGGVTWTLGVIGTSLARGVGTSLDAVSPTMCRERFRLE